ncbi:unnamed protein product [Schistosoma turkestanicum]|nr:unnamed protein product [Schistosoma turkestanicum]
MHKNKIPGLCQTTSTPTPPPTTTTPDPRSTPLLSRLLAPGFASSVVVNSTTNSPPSSNRRETSTNSSYLILENDSTSNLFINSSNAQNYFLSETKPQHQQQQHTLEFDTMNSKKLSTNNREMKNSWNSPSSSTNVKSVNREWCESMNWPGKSEQPPAPPPTTTTTNVPSNKNQSPNFQPSPDSQCWRLMTSVHRKNDHRLLPRQLSSSNTCSSATTQDELESSIDSPGIFNRRRCNVASNDRNHQMYAKTDEFSTNASSSGDADDSVGVGVDGGRGGGGGGGDVDNEDEDDDDDDDGDDDGDHAVHQTLHNDDEMESNTRSDEQDDDDGVDGVVDNVNTIDHDDDDDRTVPNDNDTIGNQNNHNNDDDNNDDSNSMQLLMIHRSSHSYVNESQEMFALHEEQENYQRRQLQQQQQHQQQQQNTEHYTHHSHHHHHRPHHSHQQQLNKEQKLTPQIVLPNSSEEPCDFEEEEEEEEEDYSNQLIPETDNLNSQGTIQPPPPPPPPYRIPDHLQPTDESSCFTAHSWFPPNYHLSPYAQLPFHHQHQHHHHQQQQQPAPQPPQFFHDKLFPLTTTTTTHQQQQQQYDMKYSSNLPQSTLWPFSENSKIPSHNNCLSESLSMPYPGDILSKHRVPYPMNKEELSKMIKTDFIPPFTSISSQPPSFPIRWCYHGFYMAPRLPPTTSISFHNHLPIVACCTTATGFVLTATTTTTTNTTTTTTTVPTSHSYSSLAYEYNRYRHHHHHQHHQQSELPVNNNNNSNNNNAMNGQFITDMELLPSLTNKPESMIHSNVTQMEFLNLLKENQQLKQRLLDINVRLQYVDELEWHVQQLSHLVESMILSHQRQCELDYQLQIYSPLSAPPVHGVGGSGGGVGSAGAGVDLHRFKIPPNSSSSSTSSSPFGLTTDHPCFHYMPANPGSLPVMPTNMSSCRTHHPCTVQNITRRMTQPNIIMPTRFYGPRVKQTLQPEKMEQRTPMLHSIKRSLHPHLVSSSMDPRTVSLDRISQPRNASTTSSRLEAETEEETCHCIQYPLLLHEPFTSSTHHHHHHSKEHPAYMNPITKDSSRLSSTTPNVSTMMMMMTMIPSTNPYCSPNYGRRRSALRTISTTTTTTTTTPPLDNGTTHLLAHSNVPAMYCCCGCCSPPPPPRLLPPIPYVTSKPIANPTIKITDENKLVNNISSKFNDHTIMSNDSTNNNTNNTNNHNNNNRPKNLSFMTEKSEILDDSQMLLRHLSPNNEFQCVNSCTVVATTTTCQLTHYYPLCVIDQHALMKNETSNDNNTSTSTSTTVPLTSTNMMTVAAAAAATTMTSVVSTTVCSSVSSIATKSNTVSHHRQQQQQQQFKEKSCLTKPKCTLPSRINKKTFATSTGEQKQSQQHQQRQSVMDGAVNESTNKRVKQSSLLNRSNAMVPRKKYNNNNNQNVQNKSTAAPSTATTTTTPTVTNTQTSNKKTIRSTTASSSSIANQDLDYSGSYEGVSNSNSLHSQSSEASSLEPDSTLSENLSGRKHHYTMKHSIGDQKNSTTNTTTDNSSITSQSSKMLIIPTEQCYSSVRYQTSNELKSCSNSTLSSPSALNHSIFPQIQASSPGEDSSLLNSSPIATTTTTTTTHSNISCIHINNSTSFTPCHLANNLNSMTHTTTSMANQNFVKKPNLIEIPNYYRQPPPTSSHLQSSPSTNYPLEKIRFNELLSHPTSPSTTNRSLLNTNHGNIRPSSSLLNVPQKNLTHQVRFASPVRLNPPYSSNANSSGTCSTTTSTTTCATSTITTNTTTNNNNRRIFFNTSIRSPIMHHSNVNNQSSSTINSIVSPNLLRKQYYYHYYE